MKTDRVLNTGKMSDEEFVLGIELDTGTVALVGQRLHGVTPICSKKARASFT
ncbi:hypothetical protein [Rhodospirillum sp. A1_3_36]|uniref:hypothetical protein n=1 Tax=Rhodospirillum sp. A1_3_36 TaxID=3391666 RepID=UPI0039A54CDE